MKTFLGIDFGTTQTTVMRINGNAKYNLEPEPVEIDGRKVIDTALGYDKRGNVVSFGTEALKRISEHANATFFNFKPYIGSDKIFRTANREYSPEDLSLQFLTHLHGKIAKRYFNMESLSNEKDIYCVIGCPAAWDENKRRILTNLAEAAGFPNVTCCDEPCGVIYYYYCRGELSLGKQIVLVYDFGGGTTDVAIEKIEPDENGSPRKIPEILAVSGIQNLGGKDFDELLKNHFIRELQKDSIPVDEKLMNDLECNAKKMKESLMTKIDEYGDYVEEKFFINRDLKTIWLNKYNFDDICGHLISQCAQPVEEVLKKSNIDVNQIAHIILAGGSSRLYYIKDELSRLFPEKKIQQSGDPVEVVAKGLALYGLFHIGGASLERFQDLIMNKEAHNEDKKLQEKSMNKRILESSEQKGVSGNQDRKSPRKKTFWFYIFLLVLAFLFVTLFLKGQMGNILPNILKPATSEQPLQRELSEETIRKICEKHGFPDGQTFKEDREDYGLPGTAYILKYILFDGERNLWLTWKENGHPSGIFFCRDKIYFAARNGEKGSYSYDSLRESNSSWDTGDSIGKTDDDKKKINDVLNEIRTY